MKFIVWAFDGYAEWADVDGAGAKPHFTTSLKII